MTIRKVTKQIPYACPVCKGKGELGPDQAQYGASRKYDDLEIYSCHACNGSCLIWEIREEEVEEIPPLVQVPMPQTIIGPAIPNQPFAQMPQWTPDPNIGPITIGDRTWSTNIPPEYLPQIGDGVTKCHTCGVPQYMEPGLNCKSTHVHYGETTR